MSSVEQVGKKHSICEQQLPTLTTKKKRSVVEKDRYSKPTFLQHICQVGVGLLAITSLRGVAGQAFNTTGGAFANNGTGLPVGLPNPATGPRFESQQVQISLSDGSLLPARNCSIPPTYYRVPDGISNDGPVCFRSGPAFAVADRSTQNRVDTYEILDELLWEDGHEPSLADFSQAFDVMYTKDQLGERLNRREYALAPAFPDASLTCRYNQTTQRLFPDRCYSGNTIEPAVLHAFANGALQTANSRFYGGVIRAGMDSLLDLSALAEAYSCIEDAQDCVSFISYVGVQNAPDFPLRALAAFANSTDTTVYRSLLDAEEGLACLRFRTPSVDFTEGQNLALLQQQVNTGLTRLMALRLAQLHSDWSAVEDKSLVADAAGDIWASTSFFLHRASAQLSPALAANLTQAAIAIGNYSLGGEVTLPTPAQTDALIVELDNLVPCA